MSACLVLCEQAPNRSSLSMLTNVASYSVRDKVWQRTQWTETHGLTEDFVEFDHVGNAAIPRFRLKKSKSLSLAESSVTALGSRTRQRRESLEAAAMIKLTVSARAGQRKR